jgi:(1->4)-alpha-D-glucan 1-alpha-D-glucosylmutase
MRVPTSTYRLQITSSFTLDDACEVVPALAGLGVSHVYLSPLLQASDGSGHGYDVVEHGRIDESRGGIAGLRRLSVTAREHGLGLVLDIVPNHMSVRIPHENAAWWDVLRHGRSSSYAAWFDIDWDAGPLLLPVLGSDVDVAELSVEDGELRYYEHRFPIAPGTAGGTPREVHDRQAYRLVDWRRGSAELTYRRFFDVTDLAGLRVEDDGVFDATHALVIDLVREGILEGLRIDHPDGLADPGGYLCRLQEAAPVWTVVEKILEPGEVLAPTWQCAGTTGYDAARLVTGSFVDPDGEHALTDLWRAHGGTDASFGDLVLEAKTSVTREVLAAEVNRLARMAPEIGTDVLAETLARFPVYRSYLPDFGRGYLEQALAGRSVPRLADASDPLCTRFQQTSGMVMAKGVEDTAFYRHHLLTALNEVGSDPAAFGVAPDEWHAECSRLERDWPDSMTLLSTHDSKRSEDVRARLALLSQDPARWARTLVAMAKAAAPYAGKVAPEDQYLLHQTLCGTGVISAERLGGYLRKATREAKRHTSWLDPDEAYDADLQFLARAVLTDEAYLSALSELHADWAEAWQRTLLAQKLLQLTMPGVPDLYQGSERTLLTLVDPDNRGDVDFAPLAGPDSPKTALVRTVLRLRRDRPELFRGYARVDAGADALAFHRSDDLVVVVATRALRLQQHGFGNTALDLEGSWTDVLTQTDIGSRQLDELVGPRPGALLVRRR